MTTQFGDMSVDDFIIGEDPLDELYLGTDLIYRSPSIVLFGTASAFSDRVSLPSLPFTYQSVNYVINRIAFTDNRLSSEGGDIFGFVVSREDGAVINQDVFDDLEIRFVDSNIEYDFRFTHARKGSFTAFRNSAYYQWFAGSLLDPESLDFVIREVPTYDNDTPLPYDMTSSPANWIYKGRRYTLSFTLNSTPRNAIVTMLIRSSEIIPDLHNFTGLRAIGFVRARTQVSTTHTFSGPNGGIGAALWSPGDVMGICLLYTSPSPRDS